MGLCLMMLMIIQTKTLSLAKSADEISILTESKNIKQPAKKSQKRLGAPRKARKPTKKYRGKTEDGPCDSDS
jgi:hypothetical protein